MQEHKDNQPQTIAFIPARGGSKSIPLKNIKKLNGFPLIAYSIKAALNCPEIDQLVVSTDSNEIEAVVRRLFTDNDKLKIFRRNKANASDQASTESAMLEYSRTTEYCVMVLIQATSPIINSKDLSEGINKYKKSKAGGLLSVVRQKRFLWRRDQGSMVPVNYDYRNRPRRQDFEGYLVENGAFYITSKRLLEENKCRLSEPIITHEMSESSYFEIDEPVDWLIMESLIRKEPSEIHEEIASISRNIKLFLTDVDGVLTDSGMYYSSDEKELKKFNTRDGKAFELLKNAGIKVGIVTSEDTPMVNWRGRKLKADFVFQGCKNKLKAVLEIIQKENLSLEEIAYIGDDINDLEVLQEVGLSACPSDAMPAVRQVCMLNLQLEGGKGAVREFAEIILRHR